MLSHFDAFSNEPQARHLRNFSFSFTVIYLQTYINIRGKISKYVTNGSKTAVMDVIVFLCVSLGSSTVQLRDSLGSRRACACWEVTFGNQNDDRAWGVYYRRVAFCCAFFFLWAKGLNAKDIHKEIYPVYGGKCLSRKAVHNWVENVTCVTFYIHLWPIY
jgi:hypothetical protein